MQDSSFSLAIKDNGIGFTPGQPRENPPDAPVTGHNARKVVESFQRIVNPTCNCVPRWSAFTCNKPLTAKMAASKATLN